MTCREKHFCHINVYISILTSHTHCQNWLALCFQTQSEVQNGERKCVAQCPTWAVTLYRIPLSWLKRRKRGSDSGQWKGCSFAPHFATPKHIDKDELSGIVTLPLTANAPTDAQPKDLVAARFPPAVCVDTTVTHSLPAAHCNVRMCGSMQAHHDWHSSHSTLPASRFDAATSTCRAILISLHRPTGKQASRCAGCESRMFLCVRGRIYNSSHSNTDLSPRYGG
jgi:hypothetical protein